jgi:SAM-dependent methyltransferase
MTGRDDGCIVCGASALREIGANGPLLGSTTKADALHPFQLRQCLSCGHVQKALNAEWLASMDGLYERHYDEYRVVGRQVNFVDGKIVSRDGLAVRKLASLLDFGDAGSILDVGCGAGRFLQAFGEEMPGWSLAGFDVGDLHKANVLAIPGAEFFHGDGELGKIPRKFDLITLNHVVEHLEDPVAVLREVSALLKPDGYLVIRVPCFLSVHTDFFLLEHCSHFTFETMTNLLGLAGFRVAKEIDNLSAIEIGVAAQKSDAEIKPPANQAETIKTQADRCLAWARSLPELIRKKAGDRQVGVFGVGGAGLWLGVYLRGEISFYVDEDIGKQGHNFAGCPIVGSAKIPPGAVVFVTFNNAQSSQTVYERLVQARPDVEFIVPPEVEGSMVCASGKNGRACAEEPSPA